MVYAYLRVSTDKQDGINQKKGIDEFCQRKSLVIDEYIDDEGISGTVEPDKRKLGRLLKKLKSGDVLVAGEISRLGRSLFMIMRILEYCMNNGIKVYTVKDNYELGDNITSFGDIVTREFEQVESIKDYGNSIYIYARNTLNDDKYRIVIYK
jgi:putative DNA-invertase from lambdoid prophage Rac